MRQFSLWAFCALFVIGVSTADAQVVISQVYGGGGNKDAPLKNDFIELFNRGNTTVTVDGWSVQYASSAGTTWQSTPLSGSIQPGQYYLVQQAAGSGVAAPLPAPDATGSIAMALGSGKVALVSSTVLLGGTCGESSASAGAIVDFVGFGSANCFEGTGGTAQLSNTTSAHRASNGCVDTNQNNADFSVAAPAPRNTSSPRQTCSAGGETSPTGTGSALPASALAGAMTLLSVDVVPGANPDSTGLTVVGDLSAIGGSSAQPFVHEGGDSYSFQAIVASDTPAGDKALPVAISDAQGRSGSVTIAFRVDSPAVAANHVVISQVYGGGGNSGAIYNRDFVELYNPTDETFDLAGWTLQYASATGTVNGLNNTLQPLAGLIGPGQYLLYAGATGSNGVDLPEANILGHMNLAGVSGKIALVRNSDLIVEGSCPLADPDIVDYVGYGSVNCSEGSAPAPRASSTLAVLRRNGGEVDTNNNAADFDAATPAPRRTAPIMEVGPSVVSTDPGSNGFNAPRDASVTITFSEAVTVDEEWFVITCATTGAHPEATVAGGGRMFVITPNVNFAPGEQCSVTILAASVRDEDVDDVEPGTDTLSADHTWTFTVATGAAPPFADDVHLTMGNPSDAAADVDSPQNFLMIKPEFALSYNRDRGTPNWVSWHLSDEWVGSLRRFDTFRPDPAVPPEWYRVQAFDFSGSGFDRGHMVPNADRDNEASRPINQATFLMTNMIPQAPDNNQGPWANFENYLRTLLPDNEIYVVAGGTGTGGTGSNGFAAFLADGRVAVPAYTWKAVLVLPKFDGNDVERVEAATRTIAVIMPNSQGIRTTDREDWRAYMATVDDVESLSGYDLFSAVRAAVQNSIEAGRDGANPPGAADQSIGVHEDGERSFTLDAVAPHDAPMTTTLLTQPSHGTVTGSGTVLTYAPVADFNGEDEFTYLVSDGNNSSNTATVTLVVMEENDVPSAGDDTKVTNDNTTLSFAASDLLTNDSAGPADEASQTLSVEEAFATAETHGTVQLDGGVISYVPAQDFSGTATFAYRVCDDGTSAGAFDPKCAAGNVVVTVLDTTAPVISDFSLSHSSLWPVNHRMIDVTVSYTAADAGDPSPQCSLSVISSEPADGPGDGATELDWEVVNNRLVRLRAERSGTGEGRIYTVSLSCSDASGNISQQNGAVTVGVAPGH